MEYKLVNDIEGNLTSILLVYNNKFLSIPLDKTNTDYQEYLQWTKASPMNVAEPADEVTE